MASLDEERRPEKHQPEKTLHHRANLSVYMQIRTMVIDNAIRPNERLSIRILADKFDTSSTRVREALIRLAVEGLVVHYPNGGFFTRPMAVRELADAYEFAIVLLEHCVKRPAPDFDGRSWDKLMMFLQVQRGALERLRKASAETQSQFVEELYIRLAALSENQYIIESIQAFILRTTYVRRLDFAQPLRAQVMMQDMEELVELISARDCNEAITNLYRQFETRLERLPELVNEGNARSLLARPLRVR